LLIHVIPFSSLPFIFVSSILKPDFNLKFSLNAAK
jgi:hypothetical protein